MKAWTAEEDSYLRLKISASSSKTEDFVSAMALDSVFEGHKRTREQIKNRLMTLGLLLDAGGPVSDVVAGASRVHTKRFIDLNAVGPRIRDLEDFGEHLCFLREKIKACKLFRCTETTALSTYAIVPTTGAEFGILQKESMGKLLKLLRFSPPTRCHRFWRINPGLCNGVWRIMENLK